MKIIAVESPTKSKTIQKFLKKDYKVVSSYGHVRDLPKTKLGIDVENNFEPQYVVGPKMKKTVKEIKSLAQKAEIVLLATDPDREGEAISWHLAQALELPKEKYQRVVFHEITESAIKNSLENPRDIDLNLVNAQQARRILDRLVGYKLSPLLWKKVIKGLSAGRVQSVALRFIVEREKEIKNFEKQEYWTIEALLQAKAKEKNFSALLTKKDGKIIPKLGIEKKQEANKIIDDLKEADYKVKNIEKKETKRNPLPPFTTSTLQQTAWQKFKWSAKQTMMIAQQLYEKGYITYHRTDSYNLSFSSTIQAKEFIIKNYGEKYWKERKYKTKSKGAQEAHEAIRPSYPNKNPENLKLDSKQSRLYDLVWRRFMACQMEEAVFDSISVEIEATSKNKNYLFKASGQALKFDGFSKVYPVKYEEIELPLMEKEETLNLIKIIPEQHFTQPPPRYNDASLIKVLEKNGIGRPSTYAPIISVIQERNYAIKNEEKKFIPTDIGTLVNDLLTAHFPNIVDVEFTAQMEKKLDDIAEGKVDWTSVVGDFYYPFEKNLMEKEKSLDKKEITEEKTEEKCEKCGKEMVIKIGRFGKFIACSNYPECRNSKPLEKEEQSSEPCEKCGGVMILKRSQFGSFWGCSNYPECRNIRKNEKTIDIDCPECSSSDRKDNPGKIVIRKSKKGRTFYGCNRYPDCRFISNKKPEPSK